ncbi:hypothetical protein [Streptomyces sp. NBC_00690]|uniref:hypothetical protein n=1 Tax=Streptomyces sp. NBC_00690 TaxID=2975808 RepID=UPI002E29D485|nr:hypothetical protein [Streptomyces sp. NBC_00690]
MSDYVVGGWDWAVLLVLGRVFGADAFALLRWLAAAGVRLGTAELAREDGAQ